MAFCQTTRSRYERTGVTRPRTPTPYSLLPIPFISTLHHVDVFDRDGAAIAVVDDDDGETDGGLAGGDCQHEQGEHLADEIADEGREGDEGDVNRQQHQLD